MNAPMPLNEGEIHLWLTHDREIRDPALLETYHRLLSPEETRQQQRFHFEKDRHQYLITRALVRTTLSRYAPIAPEDWQFEKLEHGRPRILNPHPQAQSLTFNLTHTAGLIVLGIQRDGELGIDTENIQEREAPLDVSHRYFSPRERADLHALPKAAQNERFFHYWTLKEAYIKARSKGLSLPLDQFSFTWPTEDRLELHFDQGLPDNPERWQCWLLQATPAHLLALCSSRKAIERKLTLLQVVPLSSAPPLPKEIVVLRSH